MFENAAEKAKNKVKEIAGNVENFTEPMKKATQSKKCRLLRNPNQTAEVQNYFNEENIAVIVQKDGYYFSLDKAMDATVEYFKKEHGFIEVQ